MSGFRHSFSPKWGIYLPNGMVLPGKADRLIYQLQLKKNDDKKIIIGTLNQ